MKAEAALVGPDNDRWIRDTCRNGAVVVWCCWGSHGMHQDRAGRVLDLLAPFSLLALKTTACRQPGHPLYVFGDTVPRPFQLGALAA
jgi:hypothetical protein